MLLLTPLLSCCLYAITIYIHRLLVPGDYYHMFMMLLQRPLRSWFLLFLALNIVDLISTFVILQLGMVEGNPLEAFLLQHVGILVVMVLKIILIGLATLGVDRLANRSADSLDLACNLLIGLSGVVLLLFTVNLTQCAVTYF